jgi:uncharacterized membrane protein
LADILAAVAFFAGVVCLVVGAFMVYEPAGWIVGGLLLVVTVWLYQRGRDIIDIGPRA